MEEWDLVEHVQLHHPVVVENKYIYIYKICKGTDNSKKKNDMGKKMKMVCAFCMHVYIYSGILKYDSVWGVC